DSGFHSVANLFLHPNLAFHPVNEWSSDHHLDAEIKCRLRDIKHHSSTSSFRYQNFHSLRMPNSIRYDYFANPKNYRTTRTRRFQDVKNHRYHRVKQRFFHETVWFAPAYL